MEEYGYNQHYLSNFQRESKEALHMTEFMSQFVDGYSSSLQEAKEFIYSERFLDLMLEIGKDSIQALKSIYSFFGLTTTVGEAASYAKKRWLSHFFEDAKTSVSQKITAPQKIAVSRKITAQGIKIPNWLGSRVKSGVTKGVNKIWNKIARKDLIDSTGAIIKHSTKTAKALSALGAAISIGFGIWDTINGVNKIREGSALSDEFREVIDPLDKEKDRIIEFWSLSNKKP